MNIAIKAKIIQKMSEDHCVNFGCFPKKLEVPGLELASFGL